MPQPLKDIEDRIELLKMTLGMFAPGEPEPVAAELVQLGEEILEHALIAAGHEPETAGGSRLMALLAQCRDVDKSFATLDEPCRSLLEHQAALVAAPSDGEAGARLVAAAAAAGQLCAFVVAKPSRSSLSGAT